MKITIKQEKEVDVRFLKAECGVRYWEDATVNGVEDEKGELIPCREGDCWCPIIDLQSGFITNWEQGKEASIHYKVCDAGTYTLLDENHNEVKSIDGYVPDIMSPQDRGYGDYVIMKVDQNGIIQNWKVTLDEFDGEAF